MDARPETSILPLVGGQRRLVRARVRSPRPSLEGGNREHGEAKGDGDIEEHRFDRHLLRK